MSQHLIMLLIKRYLFDLPLFDGSVSFASFSTAIGCPAGIASEINSFALSFPNGIIKRFLKPMRKRKAIPKRLFHYKKVT